MWFKQKIKDNLENKCNFKKDTCSVAHLSGSVILELPASKVKRPDLNIWHVLFALVNISNHIRNYQPAKKLVDVTGINWQVSNMIAM